MAAAVCVLLGFAAFTNHVWEDYYITLRSSRNLVEGFGLVFQPGERLHTFTSPLGVLLPALCLKLAGSNVTAALWLFRLISTGFTAGAVTLAWRRAASLGLGRFGLAVLAGLLLCDPKLADFSINGQEAGLLVFFTLLLWSELERPEGLRTGWIGTALAGLAWTRPDAFVLAGALLISQFLRPGGTASVPSSRWLKGALLGAVLYAPWFIFAWAYYGSPIPHTILAKAQTFASPDAVSIALTPFRSFVGSTALPLVFLPSYFGLGGWPAGLFWIALGLGLVATYGWLLPALPAVGRRASLAAFFGVFYLTAIHLFPWYIPPWTALSSIALAWFADGAYEAAKAAGRPSLASLVRALGAAAVLLQAGLLAGVGFQTRTQQRVIEEGIRHPLGVWLGQTAARGDTVFLEPLGYISFFSRLKTYDYPGLSSREVVEAIRGGAGSYADIIARLHPNWLVLRPAELARAGAGPDGSIAGYRFARAWDGRPALDAVRFLPGRGLLELDAVFLVYQRTVAE